MCTWSCPCCMAIYTPKAAKPLHLLRKMQAFQNKVFSAPIWVGKFNFGQELGWGNKDPSACCHNLNLNLSKWKFNIVVLGTVYRPSLLIGWSVCDYGQVYIGYIIPVGYIYKKHLWSCPKAGMVHKIRQFESILIQLSSLNLGYVNYCHFC